MPNELRSKLAEGRRPRLVMLGVALIVTCAAIGAMLERRPTATTDYLVLTRPVSAGSAISRSDLSTVSMSSSHHLQAIPLGEASAVLGRRAAENLPGGTLLVSPDLSASTPPRSGYVLVGTSLGPAQMPSDLSVGDDVAVILAGTQTSEADGAQGTDSSATTTRVLLGSGTVFAVSGGSSSASGEDASSPEDVEVTIEVAARSATAIAVASAAGNVSLVQTTSPVSDRSAL